jgi:hypothetical protein
VTAGSKTSVLELFAERTPQRLLKGYSEEPGKALVIFAQPAPNINYKLMGDSAKRSIAFVESSINKDTLIFWYKNLNLDSLVIAFNDGATIHDTISIRLFKVEGKTFSRRRNALTASPNFKTGEFFDLNKVLVLNFNHPVSASDFSKINLMEDSVTLKELAVNFSDSVKRKLEIRHSWKEKSAYQLFIPPAAFTDIFGLNNDTLAVGFKTLKHTDYGTLALKITLPAADMKYIVQLIDDKENVYRSSVIKTDTLINYDFLVPGKYHLKITEDGNKNGEWDTGNYLHKIQPEKVMYYPEAITIRANWDVDVNWKISFGNEAK